MLNHSMDGMQMIWTIAILWMLGNHQIKIANNRLFLVTTTALQFLVFAYEFVAFAFSVTFLVKYVNK